MINLYVYTGDSTTYVNHYVIQIEENIVIKIAKETNKCVSFDYYRMGYFPKWMKLF